MAVEDPVTLAGIILLGNREEKREEWPNQHRRFPSGAVNLIYNVTSEGEREPRLLLISVCLA